MKRQIASSKESVQHKKNTSLRMYINKEHTHYPPHWHTDIEIICPKEGTYKVICANQTHNLAKGDILVICPAVIHEIFSTSLGERVYVQADFSRLTLLKELEKAFRLMSPALHIQKSTCPPDIYLKLCHWIDEIKEIYFGSAPPVEMCEGTEGHSLMSFTELEPFGELEIYSILMQFIALVSKNLSLFQGCDSIHDVSEFRNSLSLSSVCAYLSEHFTEDITLENIADYAGFSKYHFARIFHDYAGNTFYQFLQQKRINYAQMLLSNPDVSITDIAYQSGFASSPAFTRAFRKSTGYTPSEFRMLKELKHPLPENKQFADLL